MPAAPGLYRLRAVGDEILAYVGQTGRSLTERLGALRGIYGDEMPYRDPHTAGPALWAWLRCRPVELEASVLVTEGDAALRKAQEAVAIGEHRQRHGVSPRWNFGRMPRGLAMSSANNRRLVAAGRRFRGGPCSDATAAHAPGVPPLGSLDDAVTSATWAGHAWSAWQPMHARGLAELGPVTGLYRIRGGADGLVYVGEGKIRDRLRAHAAKLAQDTPQGAVLAQCAPLEFSIVEGRWLPHQRLELETDLIAAHTLALDRPPAAQFIG